MIGFSEERSTSKIVQTTVFAADPGTPGQNEMVVTVYRKGLAPRFSQPGIVAELAERVPGVPMTISNTLVKNGLGPFGYAVGREGRTTCMFAWQGIDNAAEAMTGVSPGPLSRNRFLSSACGSAGTMRLPSRCSPRRRACLPQVGQFPASRSSSAAMTR